VPIANAILTVENEAQAWARAEDKGRDAAACRRRDGEPDGRLS
jgi:6,7-dimethyl-8-ribityllumazine synthase